MKCWHEDLPIMMREWKKYYNYHMRLNTNHGDVGKSPSEIGCRFEKQKGRFRKKDAWDCGNPRCYICHWDKYCSRAKTKKETEADFSFKEQMNYENCLHKRSSRSLPKNT